MAFEGYKKAVVLAYEAAATERVRREDERRRPGEEQRAAGLGFLAIMQSLGEQVIGKVPQFASLIGEKVLANKGKAIPIGHKVGLGFIREGTAVVPAMSLPPNWSQVERAVGGFVESGFEVTIRDAGERGYDMSVQVGAVKYTKGKMAFHQGREGRVEVSTILHVPEESHLYRGGDKDPNSPERKWGLVCEEPDIFHMTDTDQYTQSPELSNPVLRRLGRAVVERGLGDGERALGTIMTALGVFINGESEE